MKITDKRTCAVLCRWDELSVGSVAQNSIDGKLYIKSMDGKGLRLNDFRLVHSLDSLGKFIPVTIEVTIVR